LKRNGLVSVVGVRRDKAALSSGCEPHPATAPAGSNRSSHGGNEVAEAFDYLRGLSGAMRPHYTPKLKKRTALVRALKEVFRRHRSQPIERVINLINPVLRGWVNYFAVGHSSECFSFIKDWVEKKVRRHLAHAQKRKGFGWERWNRRWLYDTLGLFNAYRVRRDGPKVAPAG
jgi:RNA-directed DNA polymerase